MHLYLEDVLDGSGSVEALGVGHMLYAAKPITAFGWASSSPPTNASCERAHWQHTTPEALRTCRGTLGIYDLPRGSGILTRSELLLSRSFGCQKVKSRWWESLVLCCTLHRGSLKESRRSLTLLRFMAKPTSLASSRSDLPGREILVLQTTPRSGQDPQVAGRVNQEPMLHLFAQLSVLNPEVKRLDSLCRAAVYNNLRSWLRELEFQSDSTDSCWTLCIGKTVSWMRTQKHGIHTTCDWPCLTS